MIEHDTSAKGKIVYKEKKKKIYLGSADKHPTYPYSVAQKLLSIFPYHLAICCCNVYMYM